MPVSLTPSKRVALAPININIGSPLHKRKFPGSMPLTPSLTPKLALTKSASVTVPSATSLAVVPRSAESFSDYTITNSRNVKADLAATKLKLRLQLAFYKLKLKRDSVVAASPSFRVAKTRAPRPRTFHGAANVNLQKPRAGARPLLTSVAQKLSPGTTKPGVAKANGTTKASHGATATSASSNGANGHLRLYHIKQLSSFHTQSFHRPPLSSGAQRLPPVHKILKTPIRTTNRTLMYNMANANANSDETIDDTADDTHQEIKRKDILGSSPLRGSSFGTPNSFLVAKSLLQLGLGYY